MRDNNTSGAAAPRSLTRRNFLRTGITGLSLPFLVPGAVLGLNGATPPSERIRFGAFGVGNRARAILPNFLGFGEIQVAAVSDCRADRLEAAKRLVDDKYGNTDCRKYPDFREMLAQKDIDAVLIATGNRWHGLGSIYAARAGKDIYCEKPISLTLAEGRKLVETCRRFGTVYQAGTQRRATASYQFARNAVINGKIGQLKTIEMQVWSGPSIPLSKPFPVPNGWNYDMWLGQSPWQPFVAERVNAWQYFWDTAEGILTDMGCHYTDQMQWTLHTDTTGPVEFEAKGEFPDPERSSSETPITAEAQCVYSNGVIGRMFQRGAFKDRYIRYIGDQGWVQVDDETDIVTAEPKSILAGREGGAVGWGDASDHIRDLIRSIQTRGKTACNPETAHRAISICQAWNIALRLGRKLRWDPTREVFDLEEANRMMRREPRAPWRA